jgi:hypothetical protein
VPARSFVIASFSVLLNGIEGAGLVHDTKRAQSRSQHMRRDRESSNFKGHVPKPLQVCVPELSLGSIKAPRRLAHIEPFAQPRRLQRPGAELEPQRRVGVLQGRDRVVRDRRRRRHLRDHPPVRAPEAALPVRLPRHLEPRLVHDAVVPPTQQRQGFRGLMLASGRAIAPQSAISRRALALARLGPTTSPSGAIHERRVTRRVRVRANASSGISAPGARPVAKERAVARKNGAGEYQRRAEGRVSPPSPAPRRG